MGVARRRRGKRTDTDAAPADVRIERLAAGGDGVGRLPDGRTIFVQLSAPGDLVRVRVVESRRRFARGEIDAVLEPGPHRVTPACGVFGRCGGCTWQHLDYAAQLAAKQRILRDALERIGGLTLEGDPPIVASPRALGYRVRTRLLERDGAVGYRERRSHRLCPVTSCPVLAPALDDALGRLAEQRSAAKGEAGEREWSLVLGADDRTRATSQGQDEAQVLCIGDAEITMRVAGDALTLSPQSFAQANGWLLGALHEAVVDAAGPGGELLLELFAGAGLFTLALARRFARVVAVESSPSAVADLRRNFERSSAGAEVIEGRVEEVLARTGLGRPDVVVLDPPRAGLAQGSAGLLADLGAPRIVYLSCDPATLARDLAELVDRAYALVETSAFDLFPQTPHVEALAGLTRGAGA